MRDPEAFVEAFAAFWKAPNADAFDTMFTDDVRFLQPMSKPAIGREAAKTWLRNVMKTFPDLCAEVDRWSARGDALFIEFRLNATIAGRRVEWPVVDRFLFDEGVRRARERASFFDPMPVAFVALRSPGGWAQLVRSLRMGMAGSRRI